MDTIFALASARGQAGVSVVRVSGDKAVAAGEMLAGELPFPGKAALRSIRSRNGDLIDRALVLRFQRGRSFTGEDVVEFQVHGSVAIIGSILRELGDIDGLRMAEAGEFTRRALENGQLNLTEVEGLSDLLVAETEAQRRQAMRLYSGELARTGDRLRNKLMKALALIEVTIDFADEEVPVDVMPEATALLDEVLTELTGELAGIGVAERLRDGFEVALVGAPNVGKSTLLNFLAGREAAITSEVAGTTRDIIEVRMDIDGFPVTFLDTAGMRESRDVVEKIGISKSRARIAAADMRIVLINGDEQPKVSLTDDDIIVSSKSDLGAGPWRGISGVSGEGVPELLESIGSVFEQRIAGVGLAVKERHRVSIGNGISCLDSAKKLISDQGGDELVANEVRAAVSALDALVGRVGVENVLDEIFGRFCLGK